MNLSGTTFPDSSKHTVQHAPMHKSAKQAFTTFGLYSIVLLLTILFSPLTGLRAEHYSGISSLVGMPYPAKDLPGVALDNAIIEMVKLDTTSSIKGVLEFRNTDSEYKSLEMVVPIDMYLNEFRPELRSNLLKYLAESFPDLFAVTDNYTDIQQQLKANFGQRLFVRRSISRIDLAKMGIRSDMTRRGAAEGEEELYPKKIGLEFRWVEANRQEWSGTGQVLKITIRIYHELLLKPSDKVQVDWNMDYPVLITGKDDAQFYAPFSLAAEKRWNEKIKQLFLVNDLANSVLAIPTLYTPQQYMLGERGSVAKFTNVNPQSEVRIAFYNKLEKSKSCTVDQGELLFPPALGQVSASSWLNRTQSYSGLQVSPRLHMIKAADIPAYEHLSGFDLTLLENPVQESILANPAMNRIENLPCDPSTGKASINIKEYCNPVFAFDLSSKNGFYKRTAWCEDVAGSGKGESISFELKQPIKAIRIHNGYQFSDEKYKSNSRVRSMKLSSEDGAISEVLPVSDIRLLNLYDMPLKAGKYKLTISTVYPGDNPVTCLSAISFDYTVPDPWFNEVYK